MMEDKHIYLLGMMTNALVTAMGMQAENKQREMNGESMAYCDADFFSLLDDNELNESELLKYLNVYATY